MEKRLEEINNRMNVIDRTVKRLEEQQDKFMARHGEMDDSNYQQIQDLMDEREKLYEERIDIEKKMSEENVIINNMRLVRCIDNQRDGYINRSIVVGETYYFDMDTYCEIDGEKFVEVYRDKEKTSWVGRLHVEYFEELMVI